MTLENLSRQEISYYLNLQAISTQEMAIIVSDGLDSTNDHLLNLVSNSKIAIPKTVLLAETQTSGKGKDGRSWLSPRGNIYMSVYWPFKCNHEQLYGLSVVVGIAVARVLKTNGVSDVQLKWPNDIYWQQQKLGGILIETKQNKLGTIDCIIGIGLNLIDMQPYADRINQKIVGLHNILQRQVSRNELTAQIIAELHAVLPQFINHGFNASMEEWRSLEYKINESTESTATL